VGTCVGVRLGSTHDDQDRGRRARRGGTHGAPGRGHPAARARHADARGHDRRGTRRARPRPRGAVPAREPTTLPAAACLAVGRETRV
jgi:hypothetical protein